MNAMGGYTGSSPVSPRAKVETLELLSFLEDFSDELEGSLDLIVPNAHLRMALHLLHGHFDARIVTPTSLISASRVPYATANRRMREMMDAGLIEQRREHRYPDHLANHDRAAAAHQDGQELFTGSQ